jgi:hypothetical protein
MFQCAQMLSAETYRKMIIKNRKNHESIFLRMVVADEKQIRSPDVWVSVCLFDHQNREK